MPTGQAVNVARVRRASPGVPRVAEVTSTDRSAHHGLIQRPALAQRLIDGRDRPLAVIVAPPGYGKSALLAEWEESDARPFIRPTVNDARRRLSQLIRAASNRHPAFVLVLDCAEQIEAEVLGRSVMAALDRLPLGSTVALASRAEPKLPLGRLRAHRALTELHTADLAMTATEADALLRREGVQLSLDEVRLLVRRTEGWPAALYLAALWLREAPGQLDSVNGEQHLVFEYLRDEVLSVLPAELHRLATLTSVLDELSGPACDAVLEGRGSGTALIELARVSPLLLAVDPGHRRYRWHKLVREALRSELRTVDYKLESELHRRASAWYAVHGESTPTIEHAAAAGDAELTGDLLAENLIAYLFQGRHDAVDAWLSRLGAVRVAGYAPLALCASLSSLVAGNPAEAQRWSAAAAAAAERGRAGKSPRSLAAGLRVIKALASRTGAVAMGELAAGAAELEPQDGQWRPLCLLLRAVSAHLVGDRDTAAKLLDEALSLIGNRAPSLTALCLAQQATIAIEGRDWDLAAEATDRAVGVIEAWDLTKDPMSALVFAAAATSRAHHGRVDEAKRDLCRGIDLLTALGDFAPWYGAEARILMAHGALWLADVVRARTLLAEASRLARRTPDAVTFTQWFDEAWAYMDTLAETRLAGPSSLTVAELRILRFLPSHRSFREIATQLDVSANTVKTQAHAIYRKLGAASRSEAVARAVAAGLLG